MTNIDDVFNYVMESPENTNPAVLKSMLNGLDDGGGGSSDLNIAKLTVSSNEQTTAITGAATIYDDKINTTYVPIDGTGTIDIILYKGQASFQVEAEEIISMSENITGDLLNGFIITGDGTLVCKGMIIK